MVNFYRKFIPRCAKILAPLNSLLQGIPAGRNANLFWNEEASTAFEDIKVALSNATLPNYPRHDSPTALFIEASDNFCGAVLRSTVVVCTDHWSSFQPPFLMPKNGIVLLIKNYWQLIWHFIISHTS